MHNLTELASLRARRAALEQALADLEASVTHLRDRWRNLTPLPDGESIRWAQAVLQLPNLAFLELDTDGLSDDADRIVNGQGIAQFTLLMAQTRALIASVTRLSNDLEREPTRLLFGDQRQGYTPK